MNHDDHVALIQEAVRGGVGTWLELGAGDGAFTLALADVLGPSGSILALDRDPRALERLAARVTGRFPATTLRAHVADFTLDMPDGPFAGVLAANSLHFVAHLRPVIASIGARLSPDGRLVVVEYDADRGNRWVPHPFSFRTWQRLAVEAGFSEPQLLHRVPSQFLGAIYGAVTRPERTGSIHDGS